MKILDIGCGMKKYKSPGNEVIGIDKLKLPGVDVVHDIEKGLPFKDNEFDFVWSTHCLEHIHNLVYLMEEVWRVTKHGAIIDIRVPYWIAAGAFSDPTHCRNFTWNTFDYFEVESPFSFYSKARFHAVKRRISLFTDLPIKDPQLSGWSKYNKVFKALNAIFNPLINLFPMFYQNTFLCFLLPSKEIHYILKTVKDYDKNRIFKLWKEEK